MDKKNNEIRGNDRFDEGWGIQRTHWPFSTTDYSKPRKHGQHEGLRLRKEPSTWNSGLVKGIPIFHFREGYHSCD